MVEVKRCSVCGKTKNCTDFQRSARQPDGRERFCAACHGQRRGLIRGFSGADARALAEEREAVEKQREEDERLDQETAALLRAQREEIAGLRPARGRKDTD